MIANTRAAQGPLSAAWSLCSSMSWRRTRPTAANCHDRSRARRYTDVLGNYHRRVLIASSALLVWSGVAIFVLVLVAVVTLGGHAFLSIWRDKRVIHTSRQRNVVHERDPGQLFPCDASGRGRLIAVLRSVGPMYRDAPSFTSYLVGTALTMFAVTVYLVVVGSYAAIFTFVLVVFAVGVFMGGALYGKGTLKNAVRAWAALLCGIGKSK